METKTKPEITVSTTIRLPVEKVWNFWSEPVHITKWCQASDDWHAPYAENNLKTGGKFRTTMAAKDGSVSFDFEGTYTHVVNFQAIEYTAADGRKVSIRFSGDGKATTVTETFEAEDENPLELQRGGWQSILDNFKKYAESV